MVCVSCAKQEMQIDEGLEAVVPSAGNFDYITAVSPGTPVKTTINNGTKVFWTDGDKIGMYSDDSTPTAVYKAVLSEPSAEADFGRTTNNYPAKVNGRYYAVYPSSSIAKWNFQTEGEVLPDAFCSVNVPKQQTAVKNSWDRDAAILVASSDTNQFAFKHAVSYLRFEVTDQTGDFVTVRLTSNNKETLSDSQAEVKFSETGEVVLTASSSAADYITLRNSEGDVPFENGAYYIALLPGDFSGGVTLSFTASNGLVADKTVSALTLNPGEISDWGVMTDLNYVKRVNPLEIAAIFKENNKDQGVVYWVDPDNPYKGKIVSASTSEAIQWSDGLIWTDKILSQDDGLLNYNQFNASTVYTDQKDKYYAIKYCEDLRQTHGGNWYLPAPKELRTLYQSYYGLAQLPETAKYDYRLDDLVTSMASKAEFDAAFTLLGETVTATLDGDADADGISDNAGFGDENGVTYWTSKVNTGGAVQFLNFGVYNVANNAKDFSKKYYVRCVRDVEIGDSNEQGGNDDGGIEDPGTGDEGGDDESGTGDGGTSDGDGDGEEGTGIDPLNPFDIFDMPLRVSLVGDSITTFEGTLVTEFNSENGGAYYPTGNVTSVQNQYWYKLIYNMMTNAVLEVNNSLRGSTVIWRDNPSYDGTDYCGRVEKYGLGNPDVVLIHGGTNDCTKHSADYAPRPGFYRADMYPGEAYAGMAPAAIPTADEFKSVYDAAEAATNWEDILALEDGYFVHAYVKLLNMIHFKHPKAKVVIIIGDALTKRAQQALLEIAGHYEQLYGYKSVNFFGLADSISKASGAHPDDAGFTYMADKIFAEVGAYINAR